MKRMCEDATKVQLGLEEMRKNKEIDQMTIMEVARRVVIIQNNLNELKEFLMALGSPYADVYGDDEEA